jgi:mercuric ion binding protein
MLRALATAILVLTPSVTWAGERTITLAVENMTCAACPITVRTAIGRVDGVTDVRVDFERKTAIVVFDDRVTTPAQLAEASRRAGYPALQRN